MFLLLCPAVPLDAKGEDVPKELAKLQGIWNPTAVESRGTPLAAGRLGNSARYTLVIVGNGYVLSTHGGTVKIDAAKQTVDLTITDGRYKGTTLLGLYELKDNTLRLALPSPLAAGERPTELKATRENGLMVYTFERDTKATKEAAADQLKELRSTLAGQPGIGFSRVTTSSTQEVLLKQIIERLERIEKRLDAMEKKTTAPDKK
jgi:uncharacterized protein (TIGR03067 family)